LRFIIIIDFGNIMETPTSAQIRRQLDEDIYSGAYKRPEGQLEVQECFKGSDMRQVSSDYGITAAYTEQGSHWRLILSFQRVAEGYQALVYDPLVGVTNMTIRPERGIEHLVLSPELDRLRIKRYNERGVVSRDRNGFLGSVESLFPKPR